MEFFLRLAEVGQTQIIPFIANMVKFFDTNVVDLLSLAANFVTTVSPLRVIELFGLNFGSLFASVINGIIEVAGSNGFAVATLNVPVWQFCLQNLGIILLLCVVMRVWDLIPVL